MILRWEAEDGMWPNGVRLGLLRFSPIGPPRFPARRNESPAVARAGARLHRGAKKPGRSRAFNRWGGEPT